jgi:hypothetical protein
MMPRKHSPYRVNRKGIRTGLEQRLGPGQPTGEDARRTQRDGEGYFSDEEDLLLKAIDTFRRVNGKGYVQHTEVLEIMKQLGYRRVAPMTVRVPGYEHMQAKDCKPCEESSPFPATPPPENQPLLPFFSPDTPAFGGTVSPGA